VETPGATSLEIIYPSAWSRRSKALSLNICKLRWAKAKLPPHRNRLPQGKVFGFAKSWYRVGPIIRQESLMKWTTPKVVEICVGMEINCYACAEL
jgi:coenzyme PQQ precursor peptide PqqA